MTPVDAWGVADPCACPFCGRDSCEDDSHVRPDNRPSTPRPTATASRPVALDPAYLSDASVVAAEGRQIAQSGVPYVLDGIIPAYGTLGMLVAFAKVGKTTFAQQIGAAVATGQPFLGRATRQERVLIIAAEDPSEYTAYLARHINIPPNLLTFYRGPILLDNAGLKAIATTVKTGYGLVLIASWQAVIRGLIKDENDNASSVRIVENVKAAARQAMIPWLIDAHSGKGEDQAENADPSRAMRGASAAAGAAGAADYILSLRYGNGPFGSNRRLSGKGRFVDFAPILLEYDKDHGTYTAIGSTKDTLRESTWRLICESGALTLTFQSAMEIAKAAGLIGTNGTVTATGRRQVAEALFKRDGVCTKSQTRRGQQTTVYARVEGS